jgi:DNA-binding MarR family transcriptional regulator
MNVEITPAEPMPSRLMEMATWLISRTYGHSYRLLTEGFAAAGAHGYHYRLLAALMEFGPASQATLGRRAGIDRSDVVAALNDLADRGLIERSADHDDRRRNVVTITPAGVEEFTSLDAVVVGIQDAVLAPLSASERTELKRLLTTLVEYHSQQSSQP